MKRNPQQTLAIEQDFWWGIIAGVASLAVMGIIPAWVGADATSMATTTSTTTASETVTFAIRTEAGVVVAEERAFEESPATSTILITPTGGETGIAVDARSVLAHLVALDTHSSTFAITDLTYFESFGSFFLNCIDTPEHLCGSWQYTVNGEYPQIGADNYLLHAGDSVYFFFGSPRMVTLSATTTAVDTPFIATLQEYDPDAGEYRPKGGFTLGVVQDDPENPFTPKEVMTAPVQSNGEAAFTIATSGVYKIGVKEDFYFPTTLFTVATTVSAISNTKSGGGGGLLTSNKTREGFDAAAALQFLAHMQEDDGSFGPDVFTDWAGIALSSGSTEKTARDAVRTYLKNDKATFSNLTDYERRAMVIMALGINPYNGMQTDLIAKIISYFDGIQMGEVSLVNDDIFALIPLTRAGFDEDDQIIKKTIAFVLKEQKGNGSWEGSVDLTAAAIQALVPYKNVSGVEKALIDATEYLRSAQKADGGFGDSFATSWVLQAIRALGDNATDWKKNGITPVEYLATQQETDGGVGAQDDPKETRIWATAYAIPGVLGKTWNQIMTSFKTPASFTKAVSEGQEKQGGSSSTKKRAITDKKATTTPGSTVTITKKKVSKKKITAKKVAAITARTVATSTHALNASTTVKKVASAPVKQSLPVVSVATTSATTTESTTTSNEQVAAAAQAAHSFRNTSRTLAGVFALLLLGFAGLAFMHRKNSVA